MKRIAAAAVVTFACALATLAAQSPAQYAPPRTPWGDPDLQGKWPGTDLVGTPLQRDSKYGTRNVLTEEEFQARTAQFEKQLDTDNADFDPEHPVGNRAMSAARRRRHRTGSNAASRNTSRR